MATKSILIELTGDVLESAEKLASDDGSTLETLVPRIVDQYLRDLVDLQQALAEADRDIETGNTVSHEEVLLWLDDKRHVLSKPEAA
jgi:predicted transcriptional regulator